MAEPNPYQSLISLSSPIQMQAPDLSGITMPTMPDLGGSQLQYNNPFKWASFGEGLPSDATFGTKLGTFMGANAQTFGSYADLIGKGLGVYTGLKGLSLASDALSLEKKRFRTNLANQTSSYNTQMRDRIDGRHYDTQAQRDAAYAAAVLPSTPDKKKKMGMGG